MHFEWNIYVRFELESWRNILWCPHGTYVPIEQTSEVIRVTYEMCRGGFVSISFVFIVIQKEKEHV